MSTVDRPGSTAGGPKSGRVTNTAADEEIARQYDLEYRSLFNFFLQCVANPSTAEDLVQDTWVKVVIGFPTFRGESSFRTWLYRVARNTLFEYYRRRKSRPIEAPLSEESDQVGETGVVLAIERDFIREEWLRGLNTTQRAVVQLTYELELSVDEIARNLGITPGAVRNARTHAHHFLARLLIRLGQTGR